MRGTGAGQSGEKAEDMEEAGCGTPRLRPCDDAQETAGGLMLAGAGTSPPQGPGGAERRTAQHLAGGGLDAGSG